MAPRLERWTLDRAIEVRAFVRVTALCSRARHFTLTVSFSTQVYKWVQASLLLGVTCDGLASHPGGSRNTPSRFMLRARPDEPLGSYTDLTFTYQFPAVL